jgi:hypothetical protein
LHYIISNKIIFLVKTIASRSFSIVLVLFGRNNLKEEMKESAERNISVIFILISSLGMELSVILFVGMVAKQLTNASKTARSRSDTTKSTDKGFRCLSKDCLTSETIDGTSSGFSIPKAEKKGKPFFMSRK